jgi:hypothetical protein
MKNHERTELSGKKATVTQKKKFKRKKNGIVGDISPAAQTADLVPMTEQPAAAEISIDPPITIQNTGETVDAPEVGGQTVGSPPALPSIPGFNLDGVSRNQQYAIRNLIVFADCAVQKDESGVFDTLARNFDSNGFLSYFLSKSGYGHLTPYGKGRDLIDYIRKVAHEIHRDMKKSIGKPIPRW